MNTSSSVNCWPTSVDYKQLFIDTAASTPDYRPSRIDEAMKRKKANQEEYNKLRLESLTEIEKIQSVAEFFFVFKVHRDSRKQWIDALAKENCTEKMKSTFSNRINYCQQLLCQCAAEFDEKISACNSSYETYVETFNEEKQIMDKMLDYALQPRSNKDKAQSQFYCLFTEWNSQWRKLCDRFEIAARQSTFYRLIC